MTTNALALPKIASRAEWLAARRELLTEEKRATRTSDALAAKRRRLPMVKIEKDYVFAGPEGKVRLVELFEGRTQLYVHHFMWNAEKQQHCPGCTAAANLVFNNPHFRAFLADRDLSFVAISRAPFSALTAYQAQQGWTFPWYSSEGSDFNYDFHVTLDESRVPIEYNFRTKEELIGAGESEAALSGDRPANSVFLREGDTVYHTYSTYTRGLDHLFTPFNFLDLTPYGRQEEWEDSPEGWPQRPTYG